jgi:hypothetical protein
LDVVRHPSQLLNSLYFLPSENHLHHLRTHSLNSTSFHTFQRFGLSFQFWTKMWVENIKINLIEIGWDGMDWINQA